MSTNIADKAVIAVFSSGAWRVTRTHAAETDAVNSKHNTDKATVKVSVCDHPLLKQIGLVISRARADHYKITLPAADDGMRLLPNAQQLKHSEIMQKHGAEFSTLVVEFCRQYEALRAAAPQDSLYVPEHWPELDRVRSCFRLTCRYLPVPALGQWDTWVKESADSGAADLRERVSVVIRKFVSTLSDKDKIFRDSLINNLREVIYLVDDLNVGSDPGIARLIDSVRPLAAINPDDLREDMALRADTATRAADICSLFNL
jgi:hypothetical protein